ncbi:urease accessory protein UreD [Streptomyces sp. TP-A0874]|uniref:urease accessory protein UreD n=1 Tax=Streptomyces sp. TP-A0874 TaxID=549819 RepID=UPI0008538DD0|nr:urease accessory protein UreD [Streptomyces sp. TP-A0874]
MQKASARLATEAAPGNGRARTRVVELRSGWPLMLRSTSPLAPGPASDWVCRETEPAAVHLTAGAAGPLGGDRLRLEVRVGAGSALYLGEVSSTLLLPGPRGGESRLEIRIRVGAGAALAWLPEPAIAAEGCRHLTDVRIALDPAARIVVREEVLFGRHGERPGAYRQRLRVLCGERPLYDQEFRAGPPAPGWDGPAVTGGLRTTGTLLVVDPAVRSGGALAADLRGPEGALMELPGRGALFSALAPDTAALRRRLDEAMARLLGAPGGGEDGRFRGEIPQDAVR